MIKNKKDPFKIGIKNFINLSKEQKNKIKRIERGFLTYG